MQWVWRPRFEASNFPGSTTLERDFHKDLLVCPFLGVSRVGMLTRPEGYHVNVLHGARATTRGWQD